VGRVYGVKHVRHLSKSRSRVTREPDWRVAGATVIGGAHRHQGVDNQDAFRCLQRPGLAIGVVADGHGAREYPRSAAGARMAVDLLAAGLSNGLQASARPEATLPLIREIGTSFITSWRLAVVAGLEHDPLSDAEASALQSASGSEAAYGTTVLGVAVSNAGVAAIAVGDGRLGWVDATGGHHELCPAPQRIGTATDSLAMPNAEATMRCAIEPAADLVAVWACTDGFSNAQVDPSWATLVAAQLCDAVGRTTEAELSARLTDWLTPSAVEGGDDTTMIVAWAAR
jgi:protein phosphatase 2C-like protein